MIFNLICSIIFCACVDHNNILHWEIGVSAVCINSLDIKSESEIQIIHHITCETSDSETFASRPRPVGFRVFHCLQQSMNHY